MNRVDTDRFRYRMMKLDRRTKRRELTKLGATPDYEVGSVQAVTEDGTLVTTAYSGSQIGPQDRQGPDQPDGAGPGPCHRHLRARTRRRLNLEPQTRSVLSTRIAVTENHYFAAEPRVKSRPGRARLVLPDLSLELVTDRGVFAHGRIDRGTELLLRSMPPPPAGGDLLDLGCGYGAIAIVMALRAPQARVWAVDVNRRARELCERNATAAGARNVVVVSPDDVPTEVRFARLYSNPPVRLGKQQLHELLDAWLRRLCSDGVADLVVLRHLGADSLAAWLAERGFTVERLRSKQGYRILEVHPPLDSGHDGAS